MQTDAQLAQRTVAPITKGLAEMKCQAELCFKLMTLWWNLSQLWV